MLPNDSGERNFHGLTVYEAVQALLYQVENNTAEVMAYFAAEPSSMIRIRGAFPPARVIGPGEQPNDDTDTSAVLPSVNTSLHRSSEVQSFKVKHAPLEDLLNLWSLCMSLRGCSRPQSAVMFHQRRKEQLPVLIENAESRIRDGLYRAARHTIEWRLLVMEVAELYMEEKEHEGERRSAQVARGQRVHKHRDVTLDWLTERLFGAPVGGVSMSAQDTKRKKVENWLRIGCPLLAFKSHCGFASLIAPGMRIPQNAFKAGHAGVTHSTFVRHLIRTFGDSKSNLASLSRLMESWLVDGHCPSNTLRIERLSEDEVRAQRNLSLPYWGEVDYSPLRRRVPPQELNQDRSAQQYASESASYAYIEGSGPQPVCHNLEPVAAVARTTSEGPYLRSLAQEALSATEYDMSTEGSTSGRVTRG